MIETNAFWYKFFLKKNLRKFKPLNDSQTLQVFPINIQKNLIRNIFYS